MNPATAKRVVRPYTEKLPKAGIAADDAVFFVQVIREEAEVCLAHAVFALGAQIVNSATEKGA